MGKNKKKLSYKKFSDLEKNKVLLESKPKENKVEASSSKETDNLGSSEKCSSVKKIGIIDSSNLKDHVNENFKDLKAAAIECGPEENKIEASSSKETDNLGSSDKAKGKVSIENETGEKEFESQSIKEPNTASSDDKSEQKTSMTSGSEANKIEASNDKESEDQQRRCLDEHIKSFNKLTKDVNVQRTVSMTRIIFCMKLASKIMNDKPNESSMRDMLVPLLHRVFIYLKDEKYVVPKELLSFLDKETKKTEEFTSLREKQFRNCLNELTDYLIVHFEEILKSCLEKDLKQRFESFLNSEQRELYKEFRKRESSLLYELRNHLKLSSALQNGKELQEIAESAEYRAQYKNDFQKYIKKNNINEFLKKEYQKMLSNSWYRELYKNDFEEYITKKAIFGELESKSSSSSECTDWLFKAFLQDRIYKIEGLSLREQSHLAVTGKKVSKELEKYQKLELRLVSEYKQQLFKKFLQEKIRQIEPLLLWGELPLSVKENNFRKKFEEYIKERVPSSNKPEHRQHIVTAFLQEKIQQIKQLLLKGELPLSVNENNFRKKFEEYIKERVPSKKDLELCSGLPLSSLINNHTQLYLEFLEENTFLLNKVVISENRQYIFTAFLQEKIQQLELLLLGELPLSVNENNFRKKFEEYIKERVPSKKDLELCSGLPLSSLINNHTQLYLEFLEENFFLFNELTICQDYHFEDRFKQYIKNHDALKEDSKQGLESLCVDISNSREFFGKLWKNTLFLYLEFLEENFFLFNELTICQDYHFEDRFKQYIKNHDALKEDSKQGLESLCVDISNSREFFGKLWKNTLFSEGFFQRVVVQFFINKYLKINLDSSLKSGPEIKLYKEFLKSCETKVDLGESLKQSIKDHEEIDEDSKQKFELLFNRVDEIGKSFREIDASSKEGWFEQIVNKFKDQTKDQALSISSPVENYEFFLGAFLIEFVEIFNGKLFDEFKDKISNNMDKHHNDTPIGDVSMSSRQTMCLTRFYDSVNCHEEVKHCDEKQDNQLEFIFKSFQIANNFNPITDINKIIKKNGVKDHISKICKDKHIRFDFLNKLYHAKQEEKSKSFEEIYRSVIEEYTGRLIREIFGDFYTSALVNNCKLFNEYIDPQVPLNCLEKKIQEMIQESLHEEVCEQIKNPKSSERSCKKLKKKDQISVINRFLDQNHLIANLKNKLSEVPKPNIAEFKPDLPKGDNLGELISSYDALSKDQGIDSFLAICVVVNSAKMLLAIKKDETLAGLGFSDNSINIEDFRANLMQQILTALDSIKYVIDRDQFPSGKEFYEMELHHEKFLEFILKSVTTYSKKSYSIFNNKELQFSQALELCKGSLKKSLFLENFFVRVCDNFKKKQNAMKTKDGVLSTGHYFLYAIGDTFAKFCNDELTKHFQEGSLMPKEMLKMIDNKALFCVKCKVYSQYEENKSFTPNKPVTPNDIIASFNYSRIFYNNLIDGFIAISQEFLQNKNIISRLASGIKSTWKTKISESNKCNNISDSDLFDLCVDGVGKEFFDNIFENYNKEIFKEMKRTCSRFKPINEDAMPEIIIFMNGVSIKTEILNIFNRQLKYEIIKYFCNSAKSSTKDAFSKEQAVSILRNQALKWGNSPDFVEQAVKIAIKGNFQCSNIKVHNEAIQKKIQKSLDSIKSFHQGQSGSKSKPSVSPQPITLDLGESNTIKLKFVQDDHNIVQECAQLATELNTVEVIKRGNSPDFVEQAVKIAIKGNFQCSNIKVHNEAIQKKMQKSLDSIKSFHQGQSGSKSKPSVSPQPITLDLGESNTIKLKFVQDDHNIVQECAQLATELNTVEVIKNARTSQEEQLRKSIDIFSLEAAKFDAEFEIIYNIHSEEIDAMKLEVSHKDGAENLHGVIEKGSDRFLKQLKKIKEELHEMWTAIGSIKLKLNIASRVEENQDSLKKIYDNFVNLQLSLKQLRDSFYEVLKSKASATIIQDELPGWKDALQDLRNRSKILREKIDSNNEDVKVLSEKINSYPKSSSSRTVTNIEQLDELTKEQQIDQNFINDIERTKRVLKLGLDTMSNNKSRLDRVDIIIDYFSKSKVNQEQCDLILNKITKILDLISKPVNNNCALVDGLKEELDKIGINNENVTEKSSSEESNITQDELVEVRAAWKKGDNNKSLKYLLEELNGLKEIVDKTGINNENVTEKSSSEESNITQDELVEVRAAWKKGDNNKSLKYLLEELNGLKEIVDKTGINNENVTERSSSEELLKYLFEQLIITGQGKIIDDLRSKIDAIHKVFEIQRKEIGLLFSNKKKKRDELSKKDCKTLEDLPNQIQKQLLRIIDFVDLHKPELDKREYEVAIASAVDLEKLETNDKVACVLEQSEPLQCKLEQRSNDVLHCHEIACELATSFKRLKVVKGLIQNSAIQDKYTQHLEQISNDIAECSSALDKPKDSKCVTNNTPLLDEFFKSFANLEAVGANMNIYRFNIGNDQIDSLYKSARSFMEQVKTLRLSFVDLIQEGSHSFVDCLFKISSKLDEMFKNMSTLKLSLITTTHMIMYWYKNASHINKKAPFVSKLLINEMEGRLQEILDDIKNKQDFLKDLLIIFINNMPSDLKIKGMEGRLQEILDDIKNNQTALEVQLDIFDNNVPNNLKNIADKEDLPDVSSSEEVPTTTQDALAEMQNALEAQKAM